MDTIFSMVRNIVLIILIAIFLDMLLPMRGTRRFLEVVVGLFVLLTILGPVVSFIQQEPAIKELDIREEDEQELEQILEQGEKLQQVQTQQAQNNYGEQIQGQIEVIARMVPGVEEAEAKVWLAEDYSPKNVGVVERVEILIRKQRIAVDPIQRIEIDQRSDEEEEGSQEDVEGLLKQVQTTVASLYGIAPAKIVVTIE